jgi:hypothetical protein
MVGKLQSLALRAKLCRVLLVYYGFDVCAALLVTLSVVGGVNLVTLQVLAAMGVVLGLLSFVSGMECVAPPMATYAKLDASKELKGGVQNRDFLNTYLQDCTWGTLLRYSTYLGLVVQLLHMSQPVGFSLSRPARAARTPFFPYCSQMYETALVQSCRLYTHKHNQKTSIANLFGA